MKLSVDFKDDNGVTHVKGELTKQEVGFLIQYAVNNLLANGVRFELDRPEEDTQRIQVPEGVTVQ